jgi:hypothetical protein
VAGQQQLLLLLLQVLLLQQQWQRQQQPSSLVRLLLLPEVQWATLRPLLLLHLLLPLTQRMLQTQAPTNSSSSSCCWVQRLLMHPVPLKQAVQGARMSSRTQAMLSIRTCSRMRSSTHTITSTTSSSKTLNEAATTACNAKAAATAAAAAAVVLAA